MCRHLYLALLFTAHVLPWLDEWLSNSLLLEKCLNWRGICVEPGVREFAMLSKRGLRSCTVFNAAAADRDGYADFCKRASHVPLTKQVIF